MNKDSEVLIETSSGNVYADLGLPDAQEMLVKAQLAQKISELMQNRRLTQVAAAKLFGMTQPKVSALLRGQFRGISEAKMIDCLNKLGRDVEIVIAESRQQTGSLRVVFA
ncbi:helix-turn-helix domain-containing protein [Rahnella variigena]|uniref:Transcriptional regulator n=1 Tax=Rahnella variigena TaxID=574964 RepID=A0ABX9PRR9_9GAMM|nr:MULTISPECIES: helix-turn-helix transcriptional regulator [Rahnella]MDH2895977.1 helix-turn-helix domain-containing protein [Rahnella variigena]RBQ34563.1 transcriptional regulator [Rahnella aquatilis]RJT52891.1 XRE family transcriptional regulator [Rahnella variigena]RKF67289.1 transcriptional regulator [Rahnella variigena]